MATPAGAQIELYVMGSVQGPIEPQAQPGPSAERKMLMPIPMGSFSISIYQLYDGNNNPVGPRQVSPLSMTKFVDATTTKFMRALDDGEELTDCFVYVYGPDGLGGTQRVLELTLEGAYIESSSVSAGATGTATEGISIAFDTLDWYNPVTGERFTETMSPSTVGPVEDPGLGLVATPNPTSGDTQFSFRLPVSGKVAIDVYDFRGRHVAKVFDGQAPANEGGVVTWNGRDTSGQPVATGVYLVKMQAGAWLTTHKMSVLR